MGLFTKYINKYIEEKFADCPIKIDRERCDAVNQYCQEICIESCPNQAIAKDAQTIDYTRCQACGCCVSNCPNGALSLINLKDETIIRSILQNSSGKKVFRFGCSRSSNYHLKKEEFNIKAISQIEVDCLARLYEGVLLLPFANGVNEIWVDVASCKNCSKNQSSMVLACINSNVQYSIEWLEQLDKEGVKLVIASEPPEFIMAEVKEQSNKLNSLNRRDFFAHLGSGVKYRSLGIVGEVADHVLINPELKDRMALKPNERRNSPPLQREILLAVSSKLDQTKDTEKTIANFEEMKIADGCMLCNVCSRLCPTGAIEQKKDEINGKGSLTYWPSRCIQCKKCEDKCLYRYVSFADNIRINDFINQNEILAYEVKLVKCKKCKDSFPIPLAKDELCPICQK
ncbi:MAG: 4Fe-4S binding protein [Bacillota bacterium]|nr:4Fe-4S binding protein [Bacillota bacterium]